LFDAFPPTRRLGSFFFPPFFVEAFPPGSLFFLVKLILVAPARACPLGCCPPYFFSGFFSTSNPFQGSLCSAFCALLLNIDPGGLWCLSGIPLCRFVFFFFVKRFPDRVLTLFLFLLFSFYSSLLSFVFIFLRGWAFEQFPRPRRLGPVAPWPSPPVVQVPIIFIINPVGPFLIRGFRLSL